MTTPAANYLRLLPILGLLLLGLTACGRTPHNNVLNTRLSAEPSILNPILSTDATSSSVEGLIFSGLMKVNDKLELIPDLAETVSISPDGKTYTFHLKPGVKWHDGQSFSASDIVFTFNTLLDPKTRTVRRSDYVINGKPIQLSAPDNLTVVFSLPEPFAPFLANLTMGILPKHVLAGKDINTATFNRQPIGTGPFQLAKWTAGQYVLLKRNPHYYVPNKPKLDQIIMKILPDYTAALVAFKKGELHIMGIEPKDIADIKKLNGVSLVTHDTLSYSYLGFNLRNPKFQDRTVRLAIAQAINKPAIIASVLKGYASPVNAPESTYSWAYPKSIAPIAYSPESSQALLTAAGYTRNPSTQMFEKNGIPLTITVLMGADKSDSLKTAQIIAQYCKRVGIAMSIKQMEWRSLVQLINSPNPDKKFDAVMMGWSLGIDPDALSVWHSSEFPTGLNFVGYHNPQVDQLLVAGRRETNQAKRATIYHSLFTKIAEDIPYVFLYSPKAVVGVYKTVKGLSKPGPAGILNDIDSVEITR